MPAASVRSATFNVALLGRTKRLGAVAGGAYLAGELRALSDLSSAWDYRRKSHEVAAYGLDAPIGWDGERLWAECESRERRWDAIFGRRIIADLPHQLSHQERVAIAEAFARRLRKLYGVAVEWAIHRPPRGGDQRNWHVHFQFTSRPISDVGTWAKSKVRAWDTGRDPPPSSPRFGERPGSNCVTIPSKRRVSRIVSRWKVSPPGAWTRSPKCITV